MNRHDFIAGDGIGKFEDEISGYTLYPYRKAEVKEWTIWRCINPMIYQGMLMVRQRMQGSYVDNPDEKFDAWDVRWRSSNGSEEGSLVLQTQDILDSFEPVFTIIR